MADEKVLSFKLPEATEVDLYAIKTKDGKIIVRTKEELEAAKKAKEG